MSMELKYIECLELELSTTKKKLKAATTNEQIINMILLS